MTLPWTKRGRDYHTTIDGMYCQIWVWRSLAPTRYCWSVAVDSLSHWIEKGECFSLTDAKKACREHVKSVRRYEAVTARIGQ